MKKVKIIFTVLALLMVCFAWAQDITVKGVITDSSNGEPIPFATVQLKGTTQGSSADADGNYTIQVPSNAILIFSSIGYTNAEVPVNGKNIVNVSLSADAVTLDDVVLTAYGSQNKKAFTGTASVVKSDQIQNLKVSSVSQALQGLASGVMVVSGTGQPGENATIRVRGVGSYSGSSEPLIVVDNVVYNGNLNTINPNDIESFTVLKDANSTALYGSRAANGVILITTKLGTPGKAKFVVTANYGLSERARKDYEYLNAQQYMETQWAKQYAVGLKQYADDQARAYASRTVLGALVYNPYNIDEPIGTDGKLKSDARLLYEEDWYDALFRVGKRQEYTLQASGGTKDTRYLISGGYLDDQGLVEGSEFKRYSVRGKIDAQLTKWLKAGLNMGLSYSKQNYPTQGGTSTRNSIQWVRSVASIYPAYMREKDGSFRLDENGNKIFDYGNADNCWGQQRPVSANSNPLGTFAYDEIGYNRFMSNNAGFLEAKFLKDFTFRSTLGIDYYLLSSKSYYNSKYGDGAAYGGRSQKERETTSTINWTNTLTWDKTFNNKHHINLLAGIESFDYQYDDLEAEKRGFQVPDTELTYGATPQTANSWRTASRNFKMFYRANYDFNDRYHLSASFTYDGTSRFAKDVRWGKFWSVGAGWNISNEEFMAGTQNWLNMLKLKFSYGTSGNQNIGYFPYLETYNTGWNILSNQGSVVGELGNYNLTWEKQGMLDVGLEFALFNYRLTGSATYYRKQSDDLLMARPLPLSAGITSYNDNVGAVRNTGVEVDLKGVLVKSNSVTWDLGANFSVQKNEVTSLPDEQSEGFNWGSYKRMQVGKSMYTWYLKEYAGVDPEDGLPMWYIDDENGERTTTKNYSNATRYLVGDALPKVFGGISTNLTWKGLYVNVLASFSLGNKILDTDYAGLMHMFNDSRTGNQSSIDVLKRWQKPGDITNIPVINNQDYSSISTAFLRNGDYLRLRNVTIGYDLATISSIKKLGVNSCKIYASADNLFTIFGTKGLDPELGVQGITSNTSSALKVISFGINLEF